jgi:hypothetical protein
MAYNERARALRQCHATRKDGQRCQGWAMWPTWDAWPQSYATHLQLCGQHAGRGHHGPQRWRTLWQRLNERTPYGNVTPCRCAAYAWPHRPGGGLCRWPDPPARVSSIPAGKRRFGTQWRRKHTWWG